MTAPLWATIAALIALAPLCALLFYFEEHPLTEDQKNRNGGIFTGIAVLTCLILIALISLGYI